MAERFVAETYHGDLGARRARELVEKAQRLGIDQVPEAPESMRMLFEEFEGLPHWIDPDLVEEGAVVWRRWAYALGALGNAGTTDTYTEGWLSRCRCPAATPARGRCTGISRPHDGGSKYAGPVRS